MKRIIEISVNPHGAEIYCDSGNTDTQCKHLDIEDKPHCTLFCEPLEYDDETAIRRCDLCYESGARHE